MRPVDRLEALQVGIRPRDLGGDWPGHQAGPVIGGPGAKKYTNYNQRYKVHVSPKSSESIGPCRPVILGILLKGATCQAVINVKSVGNDAELIPDPLRPMRER